jgi:hypothetical protein
MNSRKGRGTEKGTAYTYTCGMDLHACESLRNLPTSKL